MAKDSNYKPDEIAKLLLKISGDTDEAKAALRDLSAAQKDFTRGTEEEGKKVERSLSAQSSIWTSFTTGIQDAFDGVADVSKGLAIGLGAVSAAMQGPMLAGFGVFAKSSTDVQETLGKMNQEWETMKRFLGKEFWETAKPFAEWATSIAAGFNKLSPASKEAVMDVVKIISTLAIAATSFATVGGVISLVINSGLVPFALAAVGVYEAFKHWDSIKDIVGGVIDDVSGRIQTGIEKIQEFISEITRLGSINSSGLGGTSLGRTANKIIEELKTATKNVSENATPYVDEVKSQVGELTGRITENFNTPVESNVPTSVVAPVEKPVSSSVPAPTVIKEDTRDLRTSVEGKIVGSAVLDTLKYGAKSLNQIPNPFVGRLSDGMSKIPEFVFPHSSVVPEIGEKLLPSVVGKSAKFLGKSAYALGFGELIDMLEAGRQARAEQRILDDPKARERYLRPSDPSVFDRNYSPMSTLFDFSNKASQPGMLKGLDAFKPIEYSPASPDPTTASANFKSTFDVPKKISFMTGDMEEWQGFIKKSTEGLKSLSKLTEPIQDIYRRIKNGELKEEIFGAAKEFAVNQQEAFGEIKAGKFKGSDDDNSVKETNFRLFAGQGGFSGSSEDMNDTSYEKLVAFMKRLGGVARSSLAGGISAGLVDGIETGFDNAKSIISSIGKAIVTTITDQLAVNIVDYLARGLLAASKGSKGGGLLGLIFQGAGVVAGFGGGGGSSGGGSSGGGLRGTGGSSAPAWSTDSWFNHFGRALSFAHLGKSLWFAHNGLARDEGLLVGQTGEGVISRTGMQSLARTKLSELNSGNELGGKSSTTQYFIMANDAKSFGDLIQKNQAVVHQVVGDYVSRNGNLRRVMQENM